MSNANKNKGKAFERQVAKHLTGVFGLNFQRVPNSGAMIGGMNSFRMSFLTPEQQLLACGDLIVPSELSHTQFEMKSYKTFSFHSLYDNNEQLNKWIVQATGTSNKYWFLVMKFNNIGSYVVFDRKHIDLFVPVDGYTIYQSKYVFCKYDGFFEKNKDTILKLHPNFNTQCPTVSSTTNIQC